MSLSTSRCQWSTMQHQTEDLVNLTSSIIYPVALCSLWLSECFSGPCAFATRSCTQYQISNLELEAIIISIVNSCSFRRSYASLPMWLLWCLHYCYIHDEKYNMDILRLLDWTLYRYACILPAHIDLRWSFRCFRCCGCCAASSGTPRPVSLAIHFHTTPVKSAHRLVGSCGVISMLPTILATSHQSHPRWEILLYAVPESSGVFSKEVLFGNLLWLWETDWSLCRLGRSSRAI